MADYAVVKEWRKRNPEKVAEQARRYRARHPETAEKASLKYREAHVETLRERDRIAKREYRTTDKYKAAQAIRNRRYKERQRLEREKLARRPQPDCCEICKGNEYRIVWDHCHAHGHFRGWICDRCNRVLGIVKDDPKLLRTLAKYLEVERGEANYNGEKEPAELFLCRTGS